MATEREKQIKVLQEAVKMQMKTKEEVEFIKKKNPDRKVAVKDEFNQIDESINTQFNEVGINNIQQNEQNQSIQKSAIEQKEENIIRRDIPGNEKEIIEKLQENRNIRVTPSYDTFNPPKNTNRKYDVISLPSKGEPYSHKKGKIAVYYLTANEENLITSVNLYRDGLLIDTILKQVIVDEDIDADSLIQGDRDAIVLWLRSTGYEPQFPIVSINPNNGKEFETIIDLSKINYKEFNLKGDENGWFDFNLSNGDIIKFSFPTRLEDRYFEKLVQNTEKGVQISKLMLMISDLHILSKSNFPELKNKDIDEIETLINSIEILKNKLSNENSEQFYSNVLTERIILTIKSVNGETNREYIREYVENMRAKDARKYRTYVDENLPGLDLNIEVEIPKEENGAGTKFKTKLELDQMIFLNVIDE